ncbi:MAG: hypothetical protein ACYCXW_02525 [Solirubrobacteraceae bacterium]
MEVVLIHAGRRAPRHLHESTQQAAAINGLAPIVVGPRRARRYRGSKLDDFRRAEHLSQMGLGGFWRYTAERLFVLEECMRELRLKRCLHIESDCLLYAPLAAYDSWLADVYNDRVAVCPLTDDEDTAAVLYAGSLDALAAFNAALLEFVRIEPERFVQTHGGPMANEMRMMFLARTEQGLAMALPVTVADALALASPCVFDPGSYGQLVDGVPGEPGTPYVGDHHLIGRELLSGNYRVRWDAQQRAPYVRSESDAAEYPLANLHVHSKRLDRWRPAE